MRNYYNLRACQNGFGMAQPQGMMQTQQYPQQGMAPYSMQGSQPFTSAVPTSMPVAPSQLPASQTPVSMTLPTAMPITSDFNPTSIMDPEFTQGYLRTRIGQRVKIEFLIGTNMLVDREGVLLNVGASYLTIREAETDDVLLCDLYSIKFVRFYY